MAACGDSGGSAKRPGPAPDAKPVDPATAASISGKVLFEGAAPANPVLNMSSDSACGTAETRAESYVVDNGGLKNVFVYVKDGLGNKYIFDAPTEPAKLDQKGCHYVPHVVGVRTGQALEVSNSDETLHNVHGMPRESDNREFNQGQLVKGVKNTVKFDAPEVLIPF
jgi:plastocyanin